MKHVTIEMMCLCVCVCVCVRVADLKQMHLLNVVAAAPPQRPERPGNMLTRMF